MSCLTILHLNIIRKKKQKQNAKTDLWLCNLCKAVKTKN